MGRFIKFIFLSFCITGIYSCSSMSKNFIKKGSFVIEEGRYKDILWKDQLKFAHISWYQELTLLFDLKLVKIDNKGPFYNWFSKVERAQVDQCSAFYIVLVYELDSKRLSNSMFLKEMDENGFSQILIESFEANLRMHPQFSDVSINLYKTRGFCRKQKINKKIYITFPGFEKVVI